MTSVSSSTLGRDDLRPVLLGGMTSVSSGTDAGDADMTTSLSRIFDFYVIYKLHAVDTEVDRSPAEFPLLDL